MSELKYLGCALDESGTGEAECRRKVESERRVAGTIRSLVNDRGLQLQCARVLHEIFLLSVFIYKKRKKDLEYELYRWITSDFARY